MGYRSKTVRGALSERARGVYSKILNYSPWVQPGSHTTAWSMLYTHPDLANFAQIGWWEEASGTRYTFMQWTTSPYHPVMPYTIASQPVGSYTYYATLFDNTPGYFTFQVNGSTVMNPPAPDYFTPNSAAIDAEIHTFASQMPGGAYGGEVFADSHIFVYGWSDFYASQDKVNNDPSEFGNVIVSTVQNNIWDVRCAF